MGGIPEGQRRTGGTRGDGGNRDRRLIDDHDRYTIPGVPQGTGACLTMEGMSRRGFLLLSALSCSVGVLGLCPLAPSNALNRESLATEESGRMPSLDLCPDCQGWGRITCPACGGTGVWNEASERAGLLQREAVLTSGHCAWCNEYGEAECDRCSGSGLVLLGRTRPFRPV